MAKRSNFEVNLDIEPGSHAHQSQPLETDPFCIAILGDFSGRTSRSGPLVPLLVDRDEVDRVMSRLEPQVQFQVGAAQDDRMEITFRELDDFHPDQLVANVSLFKTIREMANAAPDSKADSDQLPFRAPEPTVSIGDLVSGSILDDIVASTGAPEGAKRPGALGEFLKDVVAPHVIKKPDPESLKLAESVDALVNDAMRSVLHAPNFQGMEARWRGVDFMVRRIETDSQLRIYLVDLSEAEAAADIAKAIAGGESGLQRLIQTGPGFEGARWSLVAADWTFGPAAADLTLLTALALICQAGGTAFLAGGDPQLAGIPTVDGLRDSENWVDISKEWQAFRQQPAARHVSLALPRFLMRVPYGPKSDPCSMINLDEIPGEASGTADYLWTPAAYATVIGVANAFRAGGWDLWNTLDPELRGLPLHMFRSDGEAQTICGETAMTQTAAERLMEAGLSPLAWLRDTDKVRLARVQSAASPSARLAGPWG